MAVVSISGQIGSDAQNIGRLTARRLEIDYVDQEILVEAARALGVPVESVVSHDERTASLGERLASMLRRFLEQSAAAGAADPMLGAGGLDILLGRTYGEAAAGEGLQEIPDDLYIAALSSIMFDLAAHGNVLIIGRGSQVILRDHPGAVHVLLVAPLDYRIERLAQREELGPEEAAKAVHGRDKGRVAFHRKFLKMDVNDPSLYHLALNTAQLPAEEAAQIITDVVQRRSTQS